MKLTSTLGSRLVQRIKNFPVLILIISNLVIIPFIISDYGESWDENHQYDHYADHALNAYGTWFREGRSEGMIESSGEAKDLHGPAFVMTVELITRFVSRGGPDWFQTDLRHFLHFLAFQIGVLSLYTICRRWLDAWSALGATLLYMTQPVFWGHGMINPKDMPFTALFLFSVSLGLHMFDYIFPSAWEKVTATWSALEGRHKHKITVILSIWALSILALFAGTQIISDLSVSVINHAYAIPDSAVAVIVSRVAKNFGVVPADVYIQKLYLLLLRLRGFYTLASAMLVFRMVHRTFRTGLGLLGFPVLMAGFALGYITSMRIAGPLAGVLIVVYFLGRAGRKALIPILVYGCIAAASMYLTWPYLWGDPVGRLLDSLQVMSAFPWKQQVLFNGAQYAADALPNTYLPVLLAVQLTEPVWALFLAGLSVAVVGFIKRREYGWILFLLLGWFILPMTVFSMGNFSFYDNFRQVLFILPPVFLMAGVVFSRIKQTKWRISLMALVVLPGIMGGILLHPYEYIYYNSFVGGVNGAQRRFELDYWATSYREAADFVNRVAEPNSYVWVEGPAHIFGTYAREDLKVLDAYDPDLLVGEYYIVAPSRHGLDLIIAPEAKIIYTVSRDGAPLSVVKEP